MAITDISEEKEKAKSAEKKDRFFSALTARVLFLLLLLADLLWLVYSLIGSLLFAVATLITFNRLSLMPRLLHKHWLSLKRASICALALLLALFSPALGIMVACTYFLMYDKNGIQEVVPSSLQEQFQEFMK